MQEVPNCHSSSVLFSTIINFRSANWALETPCSKGIYWCLLFFLIITSHLKLKHARRLYRFYLMPSSVGEFHRKEMEYGTTSVIENSLTLKAGDKIAHCKSTKATLHLQTLGEQAFHSANSYWCCLIFSELKQTVFTCSAQPRATASSAFRVVLTSLPKNLLIFSFTAGILVVPPTISTA